MYQHEKKIYEKLNILQGQNKIRHFKSIFYLKRVFYSTKLLCKIFIVFLFRTIIYKILGLNKKNIQSTKIYKIMIKFFI